MRTIVAFILTAIVSSAQAPAEIERLEKRLADRPDNVPDRVALLGNLTNRTVPLPPEQVREARRRNILWLVEHHPEANIYAEPALLIPTRGRLADPAGAAEVVGLWKELAAPPDAKPEVIANAAIYLRATDIPAALAVLVGRPAAPAISRARGLVNGAAVIGLAALGQNPQFGSSNALRSSPEAKAARLEIDASTDPLLIGSAGLVLTNGKVEVPGDLMLGEDDPLLLGDLWLRRAIELAPPGQEWKPALGQELQTRAGRMLDPQEKVKLLREAESLVADPAKPNILANLILAEFDAGDDAAAERDAQELLVSAPKNAGAYNSAQTILGRVAASRGDLKEAKTRLIASITMPVALKNAVFDPKMTLAQDVYDAGDRDSVIQFLVASRLVWKSDRGRIDRMISFVKKSPSADLVQLSRQFPGNELLRHPVPAFAGTDSSGKAWTREQLTGKVAALEFGDAPLAEKIAADRGVVLLKIQDDDVRRRFEVLTDPTVVVVDRQGNVSAFRSGAANEAEWRNEFESGFGRGTNPAMLPAPKQLEVSSTDRGKVALAWEPVENAESYVVEWDSRDEKGWNFDQDKTVRVIATRDCSAALDLNGFTRVRWRVFAVGKAGPAGPASSWREMDGTAVTKIYK